MESTGPPTTVSVEPPRHDKIYDTPKGFALIRKILVGILPYEPHCYQIEGICPIMDGVDLLATTATGTGKTGFFMMLMLLIRAISQDPTLALSGRTFPKDPAMVLVCPTKALQEDMVCS
jgi:ATP-dependent helicase YprA (DUF1998 family)